MAINHDALESLAERQRRVFYREASWGFLDSNYVPGELYLLDDVALVSEPVYAMVIGEAPGATEHVQRRPFVGQAGVMLRRLLESVSLPPAWITNVVKFRPPGNRTPTAEEIELAKPYLREEWHAIGKPRTVICLGNVALIAVTGRGGVLKRAGKMEKWAASDGGPIDLWPMVHPSFGVRNPAMRPVLERHWAALGVWLDATY